MSPIADPKRSAPSTQDPWHRSRALPLDLVLTDRFLALLTLDQFGAPEIERL